MRGTQDFQAQLGHFLENFDIGPQVGVNPPLDWFKIGFRCPRPTVFLILGHTYPTFEYMFPQNFEILRLEKKYSERTGELW